MTPLDLSRKALMLWRLDAKRFKQTWDSGIGSRNAGGRWNSKGVSVVYCSLDPATTILESAVHKGFDTLDTVPHVLTCARITEPSRVHVVMPEDVPNANWLIPGTPSRGQQQFCDALLIKHPFIAIPSTVSRHSWNLLFNPDMARGRYELVEQEDFSLDTRLNPPE